MKSLLDLLDKCATFVLGLLVFGVARRWLSTTPPEGLDLGGRIGWHLGDVMGAADHFFDGVPVLLALWFLLAWAAVHGARLISSRSRLATGRDGSPRG